MECAAAGVGSAIIYSAGGRKSGSRRGPEKDIRAAASKARIRLLGPELHGLSVGAIHLNASFFDAMPMQGEWLGAQSGAMCNTVLDYGIGERIGFSHFVPWAP